MRYNVTKTKLGFGFIEYEGKSLTETEAITLLNEVHERELGRMFQDVTEIRNNTGLDCFHVTNNKVTYQYQIEEDMFWKLGQISAPKNNIFNSSDTSSVSTDICLN